jgi:molybdopterin-guanine dinucleotide biosynthesis protein A
MVDLPRSALILGGGRSSRMGRDKRLISLYDTQHLLAATVSALRPLGLPIWFASAAQDGGRPELEGVAILWDIHPHAGPLAALLDAWSVVRGELLVVSADLARPDTDFLRNAVREADAHPEAGAVVPSDGELLQPLCAYYRGSVLEKLAERRRSGERSLLAALRTLDAPELRILDALGEPSLDNWNRPSDRRDGSQ